MYDTLLVPTDGSDHAVRAARHADALAERFDASVHVLAVVDVQGAAGAFDAGGVTETFVERLERRADDDLAAVRRAVDGDRVTTARVRGRPSEAILDYAADHAVDAIAMGTHGRTGIDRYLTGSVTERVLRHAEVPVLTARAGDDGDEPIDYDVVLVPTDGSTAAAAAVDHALAVAAASDATVHALAVMDVTATATTPELSVPPDLTEAREAAAERAVEAVADRARAADLDVETTVRSGSPAKTILDYADATGTDLIAMGTTGRTGLSRHLLGSTTERVVRHADVPVLAINARDDAG